MEELINSPIEQVQLRQHQYQQPENCSTELGNIAELDNAKGTLHFDQDESKVAAAILEKYTDIMAIYHSTLEKEIRDAGSKKNAVVMDDVHYQTIIKLKETSLYVSDLLGHLTEEIRMNGRYEVLIRDINKHRKKHADEIAIVTNYEEAIKDLDKHEKRLEEETRANSLEREKLRKELILLKNETKKLQSKVSIELKYTKAREDARREAHSLRCTEELQAHKDRLAKLKVQENNEYRVAADIVKFLQKNITENEIAKFEWQKRYERENLMYESGNERLSREIENKRNELEKLQLQYRERQEFIDTYVAEKEAAMELRKREEHRRDSASKIQAWWRGVMVRRKLGPYRPDERKKKRPVKSKK